jgi:ATP-dependent Clp protease ATP-binding subunit ClpC
MQPPFTDSARQTMDQAQTEARELNQEFVGTEHLALAILNSPECLASRALVRSHVNLGAARDGLLAVMTQADNPPVITGALPLSPKARRALNNAIVMSQSLREPKVSTRVLMLALLEDTETPVGTVFREMGVDIESLKQILAEKPAELEN